MRDPSQKSGGYYTTPPVCGTQTNWLGTSIITVDDYEDSLTKASCGTKYLNNFVWSATVHTHPAIWLSSANQNFTSSDFTQGILIKMKPGHVFEKIVMIYAGDHKVRAFAPTVNDPIFSDFENLVQTTNDQWKRYVDRTQIIGTYQ
jgi:hypothetical protein